MLSAWRGSLARSGRSRRRADLAAMAGIARANVSRIINEGKRQKLMSRLSGYYYLENRAKLESESEM